MILRIFKIALRLRDGGMFIQQSLKILNVFITLTLNQVFWKIKTFFEKLEYSFLVENTMMENATFHIKLPCQKKMLRQNSTESTKPIFFENLISL